MRRARAENPASPRPARLLPLLAVAWLVAATPAPAQTPAPSEAPDPASATEVRVERVKPKREKLPTLRFLRDNRDFLRSRFDLLKVDTLTERGNAAAIDPRFLDYARLLAEARAASDTAGADSTGREALLASITELGTLEARLDRLERLLAAQRDRLGVLEADFTGRQETALLVLLSGVSSGNPPASVTLTLEGGVAKVVPLTDEQRASLARGGVLQLYHGFVEPREQVIAVALSGAGWPAGEPGYLTLDPARDRLTLLRLDLGAVDPARGAPAISASAWRLDSEPATPER
jgi:hypothetical protein